MEVHNCLANDGRGQWRPKAFRELLRRYASALGISINRRLSYTGRTQHRQQALNSQAELIPLRFERCIFRHEPLGALGACVAAAQYGSVDRGGAGNVMMMWLPGFIGRSNALRSHTNSGFVSTSQFSANVSQVCRWSGREVVWLRRKVPPDPAAIPVKSGPR